MSRKIKMHTLDSESGYIQLHPETVASQVIIEATGQTLETMVKSGSFNGKVAKSYYTAVAEIEGQTEFIFDDPDLNATEHLVEVHLNGEFLHINEDYTVEENKGELPKIILVEPAKVGDKIHITIEKNIIIGGGYTRLLSDLTNLNTIGAHAHEGVAHRGFSVTMPENTLPAYIEAKKQGFKYVECDISWSKDNVPVLLHDDTIDRTSDGTGKVSELTLSQLELYDYGYWKDPKFRGTKIPTFYDFILLCRSIDLHPYIELKGVITPEQAVILVNIVRELKMENKVSWISFGFDNLKYILNESPTTRVGFLASLSVDTIERTKTLKTNVNEVFIDCEYLSVTKELVQLASQDDIFVEAWTINDENVSRRLVELGVVGITTDSLIMENVLSKTESSLVHWKFNTPDKPMLDTSGNNYTGTFYNGVEVVPGLAGDNGNGLKGNKVNAYVDTNFTMAGLNNFKVSLYFTLFSIKPSDDKWGWSSLFSNYRDRPVDASIAPITEGFYISCPMMTVGTDTCVVATRLKIGTQTDASIRSTAAIRVNVPYKVVAEYSNFDLVLKVYEVVDNETILLSEQSVKASGRIGNTMVFATLLTENSLTLPEYVDGIIDEVKVTTYK